ncbi:MAG: hypothetical protein II785_06365, partial [Lachnospiraceae bacterium]|nr:hypothetical protein [Lachnospiraceae bacterium]
EKYVSDSKRDEDTSAFGNLYKLSNLFNLNGKDKSSEINELVQSYINNGDDEKIDDYIRGKIFDYNGGIYVKKVSYLEYKYCKRWLKEFKARNIYVE